VPIRRGRGGRIRVDLGPEERALLRQVAAEVTALLEEAPDDPSLQRLRPPAHEDEALEREFWSLAGPQLDAGRKSALATLAGTAEQEALSLEEADAWLRALNDARLVLGTQLDIAEDFDWDQVEGHPQAPELAVYAYLSWVQEQLVEAVA
jgi:Domain of unknown function (DUF2017)